MRTIAQKKKVYCHPEIARLLPELKGKRPDQIELDATDLLRSGTLFEIPVRSPFLMGSRFRRLPFFLKRWIRSIYGLFVFLHEKFNTNRKIAYFLLLEQMWKERVARRPRGRRGRRQ